MMPVSYNVLYSAVWVWNLKRFDLHLHLAASELFLQDSSQVDTGQGPTYFLVHSLAFYNHNTLLHLKKGEHIKWNFKVINIIEVYFTLGR